MEAHTGVILNIQNLTTPAKSCCLLSGEQEHQSIHTHSKALIQELQASSASSQKQRSSLIACTC